MRRKIRSEAALREKSFSMARYGNVDRPYSRALREECKFRQFTSKVAGMIEVSKFAVNLDAQKSFASRPP
jgi:hypothetical protein